eukprot:6519338-Karenia_brevis.AAC.1
MYTTTSASPLGDRRVRIQFQVNSPAVIIVASQQVQQLLNCCRLPGGQTGNAPNIYVVRKK